MMTESESFGIASQANWLRNLISLSSRLKRKNKIHDYTRYVWGQDYVVEPIFEGIKVQMTGQGRGIKSGDYLLLSDGAESFQYLVEEIDYYLEPPDMWIALLRKINL